MTPAPFTPWIAAGSLRSSRDRATEPQARNPPAPGVDPHVPGYAPCMNSKPPKKTSPDHDTVLAHINDPAPQMGENPEESKQESHERIDDRTVVAKINDRPAEVDERSKKGS